MLKRLKPNIDNKNTKKIYHYFLNKGALQCTIIKLNVKDYRCRQA